jgi:hypothetical protein
MIYVISFGRTCILDFFLIIWVQNGPVGFEKTQHTTKTTHLVKNDNFGQWDFKEQTEKLVRLLLYNSKKCLRKDHAWVHFVPSQ